LVLLIVGNNKHEHGTSSDMFMDVGSLCKVITDTKWKHTNGHDVICFLSSL